MERHWSSSLQSNPSHNPARQSQFKGGFTLESRLKSDSVLKRSVSDRVQKSSESARALREWSEMSPDDWINAEHFPPLNPGCGSSTISFGLPKHSQPETSVVQEQLRHMNHPPVAAVDSNSIIVAHLPILFEWKSKAIEDEQDSDVCRSSDQILQEMIPAEEREMNRGGSLSGTKTILTEIGKGRGHGQAQFGQSKESLISHSFIPTSQKKPTIVSSPSSSRWVWVQAARVWDPTAEHHLASNLDIRRFGHQAKHLRRVRERTTDGRLYTEVASQAMERKPSQVRDARDGDRSRDVRDVRGGFQNSDRDVHEKRGTYQAPDRDVRGDTMGMTEGDMMGIKVI